MLAVLPFSSSNMSGDSEFFANGIHDDLLTQLAQLQSLRVISRTSVLEYRDTNKNMRDIGKELGVDAILEGGIQRIGDQIRIIKSWISSDFFTNPRWYFDLLVLIAQFYLRDYQSRI